MNAALKLVGERHDVIRGEQNMNRIGYFQKVLNKEFADMFLGIFEGDTHKLQEFVYGLDNLIELSRVENLPNNYLLNTEDVTPDFVKAMSYRARETRDFSLFGCQVCPRAKELISEFLSYNYVALFGEFFKKTRLPFCLVELDGVRYEICWANTMGTNAHNFSSIRFTNTLNGVVVFLPFDRARLSQ